MTVSLHLQQVGADYINFLVDQVDEKRLMDSTRAIAARVRLSGSPDEVKAFDWIEESCLLFGAEVKRYQPVLLLSIPISARLSVDNVEIPCITHSMSASTPAGGIEVRLDEWEGFTCGAAVIDSIATPAAMVKAASKGALACVFVVDSDQPPEMIVSPVWGSPGLGELSSFPDIPAISLGREGGRILRTLMASGTGNARLWTGVETTWKRAQCLVADVVPPRGRDSEFVLISGHVDSWYHGAMDNASGNACALEIVRLAAENRDSLRRGIRVAFWSGHSHGRYAGSAWYADTFWGELESRAAVHINVDCLGGAGATVVTEACVMPETKWVASEVIRLLTNEEFQGTRFTRMGDQSFWGCGISSMFVTPSEQPVSLGLESVAELLGKAGRTGGLGWWWHTSADTIDKISPEFLLRDARIYAAMAMWFATARIVPLKMSRAADETESSLEMWHDRLNTGGLTEDVLDDFGIRQGFEHGLALVRRLRSASEAVDRALTQLEADGVSEVLIDNINTALLRLARPLVRLNYVEGSVYHHDPALPSDPMPILSPVETLVKSSDPHVRCAAAVEVRRRLNRVLYELGEALWCTKQLADMVDRPLSCSQQ